MQRSGFGYAVAPIHSAPPFVVLGWALICIWWHSEPIFCPGKFQSTQVSGKIGSSFRNLPWALYVSAPGISWNPQPLQIRSMLHAWRNHGNKEVGYRDAQHPSGAKWIEVVICMYIYLWPLDDIIPYVYIQIYPTLIFQLKKPERYRLQVKKRKKTFLDHQ